MHVFVDDSGDAGLKLRTSSPHLFVAAVTVHDRAPIEDAVKRFRSEQRWPAGQEIKFERSRDPVRRCFLEAMRLLPIEVYALTIEKARITAPYHEIRPNLYGFAIRTLLENVLSDRIADRVIIDETGLHRQAKLRVISDLRHGLNSGGVRKAKRIDMRDSRLEDLLQVADMMVGAVARAHREGDGRFRAIIERLLIERRWPEISE